MKRLSLFGALLIGVLSFSVAGCSAGGNKITGSVNLDGKPLADARVEFRPRDNLNVPAADARTDPAGKFEILPRPRSDQILPPGEYVVFVRKLVDKTGNVPSDEDYGQLEAAGQLINKVPAHYSDSAFPQLTVNIKADTRNLPPFELKSR